MRLPHVHQVNLQQYFLGGEVYSLSFARAVAALGAPITFYVSDRVDRWSALSSNGVRIIRVRDESELLERLPAARSLVVTQGPLSAQAHSRIAGTHVLTGFAHMPMHHREPTGFAHHHRVFGVSAYVIATLRACGFTRVDSEPFLGIAEFDRFDASGPVVAASPYIWDRRKVRDRVMSLIAPVIEPLICRNAFERRRGPTLGIVSAIAPIKQFPEQFRILAPVLVRHGVNLEIFGNGGYAQVRDLKRALAPMGDAARFWGFQQAPQRLYPQMDYLMSGLPEKEALGLNIIEAQACGTPVLAVDASPFTETVVDGSSGYLYPDPRLDGGAGFDRVLARALSGPRPDPRLNAAHLQRFSAAAFQARARRMLASVAGDFKLSS